MPSQKHRTGCPKKTSTRVLNIIKCGFDSKVHLMIASYASPPHGIVGVADWVRVLSLSGWIVVTRGCCRRLALSIISPKNTPSNLWQKYVAAHGQGCILLTSIV